MTANLTAFARQISENLAIFVYENNGVFWLAVKNESDGFRTLRAIGFKGAKIRYARNLITEYFECK